MCRILSFCAKLRLLWQPESGPIPVAMVEKDRVMTFIRQQNASAILSDSGGNIYYKWKAEEFLIDKLSLLLSMHHIDSACKCDAQV